MKHQYLILFRLQNTRKRNYIIHQKNEKIIAFLKRTMDPNFQVSLNFHELSKNNCGIMIIFKIIMNERSL